jgi:hypothetical protein
LPVRWKNANVPKCGWQGVGFLDAILKNKCRIGTVNIGYT